MTTTTERAKMYERIGRHGRQLLAIFPDATEQDPVKLCKKLRRLENRLQQPRIDWCNGDIDEGSYDTKTEAIISQTCKLLRDTTGRVWINSDPRGYALKISLVEGEDLHRDWGGYGIIAPDLTD